MKANHKKSQGFKVYKNFKRVLTPITSITSTTITLLFFLYTEGCSVKQGLTETYAKHRLIKNIQSSIENTKNNNPSDHLKIHSKPKGPISWDQLKNLLDANLMSAEELGIVACKTFRRPQGEIELTQRYRPWRLKQQNNYWILNTYYRWNIYELDGEKECVELLLPERMYLNEKHSRILLSASKAYRFNKLHLSKPLIESFTNYSSDSDQKNCLITTVNNSKQKSTQTNDCFEQINFSSPELTSLKLNSKVKFYEPTTFDYFRGDFFSRMNCVSLLANRTNSRINPDICIKNKFNIFEDDAKSIEIHFHTETNYNNQRFYNSFKLLSESERKEALISETKNLLDKLGLNKSNPTSGEFNYGLIDLMHKKMVNWNKLGLNKREMIIDKTIKNKIKVYINFLFGNEMNYRARYDLNGKVIIKKL